MVGSAIPSNSSFPTPISKGIPTGTEILSTAAALRLSNLLHRRLHLGFFLRSSFKKLCLLDLPMVKNAWHSRSIELAGLNLLQSSYDALCNSCNSMYFFSGDGIVSNSRNSKKSDSRKPRRSLFDGRGWTNFLLAFNVLVYIAQITSQGKVLYWGAKINTLIEKGQIWRLVTSSFLHANIIHLMVNCYSLSSIGPVVEKISGPRRFIAVYMTSAIASSAMSYWLSKAPAVGASGAIFGLVGSFAVFLLRHKGMVNGSEGDLQYVARIIFMNMAIGLLSTGVDNWGHLGGLIGGVATSWLLGPAWRFESRSSDGRRVFADRAPIFFFLKNRREIR